MSEEPPRRPAYVGYGTCRCGDIEVNLYRLPDTTADALVCASCLEKAGFEVPKSRTADDIETIDGKLAWRKQ
jgi:hypothetical protein